MKEVAKARSATGVAIYACRYTITYPLEAGMVVSNEPGYYEEGEFGIRIENLLVIKEADTPFRFGEQPYLAFERLTMCPLQRKMIDLDVRRCSLCHAPCPCRPGICYSGQWSFLWCVVQWQICCLRLQFLSQVVSC